MRTYPTSWLVMAILACVALSAIAPVFQPVRAAGPWYVAPGGSDSNTCTAPRAACATVNGALNKPGFVAGDTILVASGVYTGAGMEVVLINKNVMLSGGWNTGFTAQNDPSIIDGENARQGIRVDMFVAATVERFVIQNCTGGNSPGGVNNVGTLILSDCTVRNNTAYPGGIYTEHGTLTLNNCTVSNNSYSGIAVLGSTLTVNNSTISDNNGRGMDINRSQVVVNNSAISGNTSSGIYSFGIVTINNSTISGNGNAGTNGGGINAPFDWETSTTLNSCTVSGNTASFGGGIYRDSNVQVTLRHTILAGNMASSGPDCFGLYGTFSAGYNLIGNSSDCGFSLSTGDLINLDPILGPLEGAPGYHPLLSGSPAINAGDPAGCTDQLGNLLTTDQRGLPRRGRCDIGAYELQTVVYRLMAPLVSKPDPSTAR